MERLKNNIVELLNTKLAYQSEAVPNENRMVVKIRDKVYEQRLGGLLQDIQKAIEQAYPERAFDLYIVVRDQDQHRENAFKIWKSC